MTALAETPVLNPVDVERHIQEVSNRIARGVQIVTAAEREAREKRRMFDLAFARAYKQADGPAHERKYTAEIDAMPHREAADIAEIAFKHAERTAKALEKELFAWQSINNSIRSMYGASGVGQR